MERPNFRPAELNHCNRCRWVETFKNAAHGVVSVCTVIKSDVIIVNADDVCDLFE